MRSDFPDAGSRAQVSRALKNLIENGTIVRLGYGVYAKARPSLLSGKPVPRVTLEELTQQMLIKIGIQPELGSAQKQYISGITNQVPVFTTFNTGQCRIKRKISIGKSVVRYENNYKSRAKPN